LLSFAFAVSLGWFSPEGSSTMFDPEETLTHEEVMLRFKKVFGRNMTPEERHAFFLPPEVPTEPNPENV
jgi:hypothetical protein